MRYALLIIPAFLYNNHCTRIIISDSSCHQDTVQEILKTGSELYNLVQVYQIAQQAADTSQNLFGPVDNILPYKINDTCYRAVGFSSHFQNRIVLTVEVHNIYNTSLTPFVYIRKSVPSLSEDTLLRMQQAILHAGQTLLRRNLRNNADTYIIPMKKGASLYGYSLALAPEDEELNVENDIQYQFTTPDSVTYMRPLHTSSTPPGKLYTDSALAYKCDEISPISPADVCSLLYYCSKRKFKQVGIIHRNQLLLWNYATNTGQINDTP
ncbi:hypothetical protein [Chitinophaga arvensicola]|uniref:Uncharacterized protein n=1 Tax=Chitinophaga arvensicola TaxID=29529 RepID=A0A1I0PLG1_9BACT|nr:hypothetical protein [Chitinophaga arvensicola]SEW15274.1 hypothetical protein SAMN04488122_0855 [Chitinophaga arvensicola]